MINIKTGAISLPGMLANLLYKDLATDLGYTEVNGDDSGPQSVSDFSVTPEAFEGMAADIGLTGKEARSLGHAITDPISAIGGALAGGPFGAVASLAARATAAQEEGNVEKQKEISDKFSDPLSTAGRFSGMLGGPIGTIANAINAVEKVGGFLSDLAKDDSTVAQPSDFADFRGFDTGLDKYGDAFSLDGIDVDAVSKAEALSGRSDTADSTSTSSTSDSEGTEGTGGRGSSRGMGGLSGRGGEDSDADSAGASW